MASGFLSSSFFSSLGISTFSTLESPTSTFGTSTFSPDLTSAFSGTFGTLTSIFAEPPSAIAFSRSTSAFLCAVISSLSFRSSSCFFSSSFSLSRRLFSLSEICPRRLFRSCSYLAALSSAEIIFFSRSTMAFSLAFRDSSALTSSASLDENLSMLALRLSSSLAMFCLEAFISCIALSSSCLSLSRAALVSARTFSFSSSFFCISSILAAFSESSFSREAMLSFSFARVSSISLSFASLSFSLAFSSFIVEICFCRTSKIASSSNGIPPLSAVI